MVSTILIASLNAGDHFGGRNPQGPADTEENIQCWRFLVSLEKTDVGSVHPRPFGEFLLGEPSLFSQLP